MALRLWLIYLRGQVKPSKNFLEKSSQKRLVRKKPAKTLLAKKPAKTPLN